MVAPFIEKRSCTDNLYSYHTINAKKCKRELHNDAKEFSLPAGGGYAIIFVYSDFAERRRGMKNPLTTLCYIEKDGAWLMLHRVKKQNDVNRDKWIGVGGHFEEDESPEDCLLREVQEETGLTLTRWRYRGLVTFVSDKWPTEYMSLFTADGFEGELKECDEGTLEWVPMEEADRLPVWEGDKIFFRLLRQAPSWHSPGISREPAPAILSAKCRWYGCRSRLWKDILRTVCRKAACDSLSHPLRIRPGCFRHP